MQGGLIVADGPVPEAAYGCAPPINQTFLHPGLSHSMMMKPMLGTTLPIHILK